MILDITHKKGQIANDIKEFLETNGSILSSKEQIIEGFVYLNFIVRCGSSDREYIINSPTAILKSLDENFIQQILSVNNIRCGNIPGEIINKTYDVLVYEMSIISIKQKIYGKTTSQTKYIEEENCKKIAELAMRAIYLLGLDYGMVNIAVTGGKKTRILAVDSSPLIREKDAKSLLQKLSRIIKNTDDIATREVKMGADPEFMMSNARNNRMTPASQYFPKDGMVGCDNIRVPSRQQRPVAELRPKPDCSPLQLFSNIKQALQAASKLAPYRNIKWIAGSQPFGGYSIGGHIHFSNLELNNHIMRALDNYIGLPLFLIENQATAVKRRKKYGFLADFRVKDYGGFEYRTPGSWLVSPEITIAVLCLGKIVASNYLKLTRNYFISLEAQKAFYEGDQEFLKPMFIDVWADIIKLSMYESFKDELQIIYDMIQLNIIWDEKTDIRKAWGIKNNNRSAAAPVQNSTNRSRNSLTTVNASSNNNNNRGRRSSSIHLSSSGPVFTSTRNYSH